MELVMKTTLRLSFRPRLTPRPLLIRAMIASSALMILLCVQAPAASWNRALNPQPLPPGM
jgi:hypothetical protein